MSCTLSTLRDSGVTVERNGERIRLSTVSGGPLPAQAVELARLHKGELLAELDGTLDLRTRLLAIAEAYGLPADIVQAVATAEALSFCMGMTDAELTRWANIVCTRELYRRGLLTHGWAIPSAAHVQGPQS